MKVKTDFEISASRPYALNSLILLYVVAPRKIKKKIWCFYNILMLTLYETYCICIFMTTSFDPIHIDTLPMHDTQGKSNVKHYWTFTLINCLLVLLLICSAMPWLVSML